MERILRHRGETLTLATSVGVSQALGIPPNMNRLQVEVPSATKENISIAFTPKISAVWKYTSASTTYTDYTQVATDRNASTVVLLNSLATADFLYVGAERRYRGLAVTETNTNSNASVLSAKYWNGTAWTTVTITDNTIVAGATLAQNGTITWTVPTDWATTSVAVSTSNTVNNSPLLYWVRFSTSAAFDSTVSVPALSTLINNTISANDSSYENSDYILIQSNAQSLPPYVFNIDTGQFGGIEMKSTSITSAANLNWYQVAG